MTIQTIRKKRPLPAKELAEMYDVSVRTIKRWNSQTREDWIDEQATLREAIRAYHDDEGHSWSETTKHFGMSSSAVRQRCYRARKEREAEAAEKSKHLPGEMPLFD
jgi:transposase